jgi:hypothetical protein
MLFSVTKYALLQVTNGSLYTGLAYVQVTLTPLIGAIDGGNRVAQGKQMV